ncbi:hypothetical protein L596_014414 [Steinernema carpocapsae]|uniref:MADF domain-containing protein n=1 Tax=Steinernema carpocapsae TaxID=34508 RepID=A0A4V6A2S9_STECR|nr:hypothetical protein L596_014414 [Steinernema carpocapsae]
MAMDDLPAARERRMQPAVSAASTSTHHAHPGSSTWSFQNTRDLIRLVSESAEIWDATLPEHSSAGDVQAAWQRVSYTNGRSAMENKNRWKYLRNYFLRLLRRLGTPKGPNAKGPTVLRTPRWEHWDDFAFMMPADISALQLQPPHEMKAVKRAASDEDDELSNPGSDSHRQPSDTPMMMQSSMPPMAEILSMPPPPIPPHGGPMSSAPPIDRFDAFGSYIADTLRSMPLDQALENITDITKMLNDRQLSSLRNGY